jgi:copper chaperone CopZ
MASTPSRLAVSITGMTCNGCVKSVARLLSAVSGVSAVTVDLADGKAEITGTAGYDSLAAAIEAAGFGARPIA